MRNYLLDTGPLAALLYGRPAADALIRPWMLDHEVVTSILVYGEGMEYIKQRPNFREHHAGLEALLGEVVPYFLTYSILERYADLRIRLRRSGAGLIGDVDTLIAATALERDLTVVTTDGDFERVPDLKVMRIDLKRIALP